MQDSPIPAQNGVSPRSRGPRDSSDPGATMLRPDPRPERVGATHLVEDLELLGFREESLPPPTIPGYQILGVLGEGGMGVVYRAVQLALKRPVALKMVAAGNVTPATRQRFITEAQTVARLRHP